jgi:hypothetical protein|tara:strand:- start:957 stop:1163 length:207 start_codon:yes stop_codon:yes gene_type:complete
MSKPDKQFHDMKAKNELYAEVQQEIDQGIRDLGVWTACFAEAKGDSEAAERAYVERMVEDKMLEIGSK